LHSKVKIRDKRQASSGKQQAGKKDLTDAIG